jgi:uncharacterized membrane protein
MRIIIADHNSKALKALAFLLREQPGINVIGEVADNNGLLDLLKKQTVDVILLDFRLPYLRLPELITQIRTINRNPKLIVMSSDPENARFALNAGADAYVSKGNQPEWLLETLWTFNNGRNNITSLSVLSFANYDEAEKMIDMVQTLQKTGQLKILDAALVSWPQDEKKPKVKHLTGQAGLDALGDSFWGMLFGLIFLVPFVELDAGAALGANVDRKPDYSFDDKFIDQTRKKVTKGTSALFLLTNGAVKGKVLDELKDYKFDLISSDLTMEQEELLKAEFGEE